MGNLDSRRLTLEELAVIKPIVSKMKQQSCFGCGDGTSASPYTWDEYQALLDDGTLDGSCFVTNQSGETIIGLPEVTCSASGTITNDVSGGRSSGWATGKMAPLDYREYNVYGHTSISNGSMTVSASIQNPSVLPTTCNGHVEVIKDDVVVANYTLSINSSYFHSPDTKVLGDTNFSLPSGGHVVIKLVTMGEFDQFLEKPWTTSSATIYEQDR